jgi:MATE family multidrug resistance protein
MVTWKFLSAQNVMMPLVVVVAFSCVVVLPITLQVFPALFGFLGTAWAIFTFQAIEAVGLIGILWWFQPHDPETWPGLSAWREALEWKPFCTYMTLGVGGMLASSEWMYWEALALFIGTLGVVPLSVHTIPTQVIMVMFMVPLGIGIALSVRLGTTLPQSVKRAKQLVAGTFVVGLTMLGIMAVFLYVYRYWIFRIFSEDPDVLELAEQIWWRVVLYFINLSIFGINMGVAIGLGMQWTLGFVTVLFLWLLGMPAAYYFAIYRGGGLVVAWSWIVPPYAAINVALMFAYLTKDWDEIAAAIRLREGIERGDSDIEGLTLNETHETGRNGYGSASTAAVVQ